ncbi:MAG: hybrid sensor histidine kinase/response regulator [Arcobacteraceae bacterium]
MIDAKILIVDDQEDVLFLLETILSKMGCKIETVSNPLVVMEYVNNSRYDLVILDIMMPHIDGIELCSMIRKIKSYEDVPIIFISALDNEESIVKAFEIGANDYITKPIKRLEVLARVKNQLLYKTKYTSLVNTMQFAFHELKTPINIIQNDLFLIETTNTIKESNMQRISMALQSLESLYEDMYYSVKQDDIDRNIENVKIDMIVKQYIDSFDLLIKNRNIAIDFCYNDEHLAIKISKIALERLISNTLSNSIKYSKHGSKIEVKLYKNGDNIELSFINPSDTKTDFNRFFQTGLKEHKSISGMGIGLEIVRNIAITFDIGVHIEAKNGKIEFKYTFY